MSKLYTKEEVEELLEKQRSICYRFAEMVEPDCNNPYSDNDGIINRKILKKSILNAKLEI